MGFLWTELDLLHEDQNLAPDANAARSVIARLIADKPQASRTDIVKVTGLARSTIDKHLEVLVTSGLVEDAGTPVVIHVGSGPVGNEFTGPEHLERLLRRHPRLTAIVAPHLHVNGGVAAVAAGTVTAVATSGWPAGYGIPVAMAAAAAAGGLSMRRPS